MKKKKIIAIVLCIILISVFSVGIYLMSRPNIVFNTKSPSCEIGQDFDPLSIVEKVREESIDKIQVKLNDLDIHKLGTYTITYQLKDQTHEIQINVVDTIAPEFDVVDGTTDATIPLDAKDLVDNISDETNVTISFKEDVSFDTEGEYDWDIIATDEGGNTTEKKVHVKILPKDETAPVISGKQEVTLYKGNTFDEMADMSVSDNQDPNAILKIISSDVNMAAVGVYSVVYEACDRSGNKSTFTKKIHVVERNANGNVVYLTFDDGPSYNTPKVLEILDRYQVKATFFVTGNGEECRDYIRQAHQKGHTIGLHTYTHDYKQVYASVDAYWQDLKRISDLVEELTGVHSMYIRFPGGSSNTVSRNYCSGIMSTLSKQVREKGYQYYDWNVSSSDASGGSVPVDKIISSATSVSNGTVMLLFHDTYGKDTTVQALPAIIEYYLNKGYTFKAIDENTGGFHHGINN